MRIADEFAKFQQLLRRLDADGGQLDHIRAEVAQAVGKCARLLARPRHHDALAKQRARLKPVQFFPQRNDVAHNADGGRFEPRLRHPLRDIVELADERFLLPRRAPTDECHG